MSRSRSSRTGTAGSPGVRPAGGEPVTCDSYYSAGLAQGTLIAQDRRIRGRGGRGDQGPGRPVRRRIGRSADDLTSRMLTPPEAAALQLPQGVPVIGALRTVFDTGDVPVEVQDTAPGDRHEFRYEVSMDGDGRPGRR